MPRQITRATDARWFLGTGTLLAILAATTSLEFDNDSYEHFTTSVRILTTGNVNEFVLDIWNKPLPCLLYGVPGLAGLWWARLASIIVTLAIVWCVADIWRRVGRIEGTPTAVILVAVLLQTAVLNQSYVTMTELPAALALVGGLSLHVRGRNAAACFAWGFAPLARMELIVIVAASIVWLSLPSLWEDWRARRRAMLNGAVGALPFAGWWLAGFLISGDWNWMGGSSYAYIRPLDTSLLSVNALGGLPGALTLPMIFMCAYGWLSWTRIANRVQDRSLGILLGAWLVMHLAFMSVTVVYPAETFGGLGIAAVNDRNYNVLSPVFGLLVVAGIEAWVSRIRSPEVRSTTIARTRGAFLVTAAAALGFFTLQRVAPSFGAVYKLELGSLVLGTLLALSWLAGRGRLGVWPHGTWRAALSTGLAACTLMAAPLFWYPLRWHDQANVGVDQFCSWVHREPTPTRIVQDLTGGLESYCSLDAATSATWIWPTDMVAELETAPAGAWLLVETDQAGSLKARYPAELVAIINGGQRVRELAKHAAAEAPRWRRVLDRFSYGNAPVGWTLYEWRGPTSTLRPIQ